MVLFIVSFNSFGQSTVWYEPQDNPHRGLYINHFFYVDPAVWNQGAPYTGYRPEMSILGADLDHDGIYEKENELLEYCKSNHITHIVLLDLHYFLGRGIQIWDNAEGRYVDAEVRLCKFMNIARNQYCIDQIDAAGDNRNFFDGIDNFQSNLFPSPTAPIVIPPNRLASYSMNDIRLLEDSTLHPGDVGYEQSELLKFYYRVVNFQANHDCESYFNYLHMEYEFWQNSFWDEYTQFTYNSTYNTGTNTVTTSNTAGLIVGMTVSHIVNGVDDFPSGTIITSINSSIQFTISQQPINSRTNTNITISYTLDPSCSNFCCVDNLYDRNAACASSCGPVTFPNRETAKYFSHFLPTIQSLRSFIDDRNSGVNSNDNQYMRLEAYLQSVRYSGIPVDEYTTTLDGNENLPTPGAVYYSQCTNPVNGGVSHTRVLDRLCPHQFIRYIPGQIPLVSDWTFYQDFDDHNSISTDALTDFHPILSSESIANHGYDNYWGAWFRENKKNTIFEAERLNFLSWTCNGRIWGTGGYSLVENSVHPGNMLWFAQSHMTNFLDNPKLFTSETPICSNNSTENITFHYTGPCESGTTINFRILSHSGGQIFPAGGGWFTQQTISPSLINPPICPSVTPYFFANDIVVNLTNHFGDFSNPYHVEMKLDYSGGCNSDVYSEDIDVNSGPNIQAQGPVNFCEGDYTTLHASGDVSNTYQWKKDGIEIDGETHQDLRVTVSGTYRCVLGGQLIGNCNGLSNDIVVSVNSNPAISIFSDCQNLPPFNLYAGPQLLANPTPNGPGGVTYLWSTGETTNQIQVQITGWYYLTVTSPNGCSNTTYTYLTPNNSPPILEPVQSSNIINPSSGCSSDGEVTISFNNAYYQTHFDSPVQAYYSDGTNTYTFDWPKSIAGNYPNISATLSGLSAGDYVMYISVGGNICFASVAFHLGSTPNNIAVNYTVIPPTCFNGGNGEIEIASISGGNPPYTIEIADLGILPVELQSYPYNTGLTNLHAGTYYFRITDSNCNWEVIPVTISSPNPISVIITGQDVTGCHSDQNGSALITGVSGGTPPYSYLWNDLSSSTTNHISNVGHGAYTVLVTDANGCTGTATIEISAPEELHLVPDEPFDLNTTCGCNASLQYLFYGGTGNLTVIPSSWTINGDYAYMNNLCSQSTPYTITITDANACSISDSHIITDGSLQAFSSSTSIACYGQSTTVSVTAVGGVPPYSGIGNFTETAGTYSYTVTDANNCSTTTTITITEPTNALSISVSAGTILCNGGTANVNISASGGTPPYTGTGNFQITAGTYTSIVTDANGCSASNTTIINQPLPLTVSATQTNQPLPCFGSNLGTAVAIPQGGTPPYTYLWSPFGGNSQTSTNLPAGLYTVTCDDANNCGTTSSTVNIIEDPICCDLNGNSDLHQSDFNVSHQLNHTDYDLNESVLISSGVGIVITDCDISVGAGFTITIKQGGSLTINGVTHLHGCIGMWGGIVVEPGGEFYIDGSPSAKPIIEDAEHGVYVEMVSLASTLHSGLKLRNGVFSSNYTDIFLEENSTGDINQVNIDVFGCLFNKTHDLFYSPNITQLGSSPFTAIKLNNFNGLIGSNLAQTNEFWDHNVGIQCFNSNVTVENCLFENIQPEAIYGNYFDGFAIHIKATNNLYTFHETGLGSASASPTFSNCKKGIYVEGSGGYIQSNRMSDVTSGITLMQLLPYVKFEISSNYLACQKEGIVCYYNKSAEIIKIEDNLIEMDNPQNSSGIGIGLYEYYKSAPYTVADNILNLYHARGGIEVYCANRTNVHHNLISLYDDTKNLYGVVLWSADENDISCNDVYGNSSDVTNSTQIGFKVSMSKGSKIQCNNSSTTNTGFEFNNQCPNTQFIGNAAVYEQWIGLRVLNSGVMGVQKHYGNLWVPPFHSTGNIEAENTNIGNELASEFDVNPNDGPYYLPLHPLPAGGWFIPDPTSHELDCAASVVCGSANLITTGIIDSSFDHLIATDNYHVNEFDGENGWMAKKYLFEKIRLNPLLLNDPILFSFFSDELYGILPDFDEVKNEILENASVLNANSSQLFGDHNNLDSLQKELEFADSLNQLFNGSNQAILATSQAIRLQISSIVSSSKQLVENIKQSEDEKSDSIQTINSGINTNEIIEANEKIINEVYLSTLAKGLHDYTNSQIQSILSVAHQCPYAGGKSVFLARAMYHLTNPDEEYFDNDLCTSLGYFRKMNSETSCSSSVITYPNPGNEMITFETSSTEGFEKLEIYSLDMNLVQSAIIDKKVKKVILNTASLAPGLYIYKCSASNETLGIGKISIVH